MPLELDPLTNAVARLEEGVVNYQRDPTNVFSRDALIKRFEFTYELSTRFLRRYLRETSPSAEEIDQADFPDLIRTAAKRGITHGEWADWKEYRDLRNRSSHGYHEEIAEKVILGIPEFLREAQFLLQQLRSKD
ncbi:MAG: HI0074 family nucleotidyltransferase substrate-binding subunit [Candidatus Symbiobacter sp.]|nr:HI0074 family nucleotidyltransferase substrate-binding subunit [Candidatus Symbiobacter sp.]